MRGREGAEKALEMANRLLLPLIRAARRIAALEAAVRRAIPQSGVKLHQTWDRRITVLVLDIPASRPLVLAVYTSTQESRPASPSQVTRRLTRLHRVLAQLRGKLYEQADIVTIYVTRTRLTRAAYRIAREMGSLVALGPEHAARLVAWRLRRRLQALRKKLGSRNMGRGHKPSLLEKALEALAAALEALYRNEPISSPRPGPGASLLDSPEAS